MTTRNVVRAQNSPGQGRPTAESGQRLHLSPTTVDSHRLHRKEKLQLHSLAELLRSALRWAATEEMR